MFGIRCIIIMPVIITACQTPVKHSKRGIPVIYGQIAAGGARLKQPSESVTIGVGALIADKHTVALQYTDRLIAGEEALRGSGLGVRYAYQFANRLTVFADASYMEFDAIPRVKEWDEAGKRIIPPVSEGVDLVGGFKLHLLQSKKGTFRSVDLVISGFRTDVFNHQVIGREQSYRGAMLGVEAVTVPGFGIVKYPGWHLDKGAMYYFACSYLFFELPSGLGYLAYNTFTNRL